MSETNLFAKIRLSLMFAAEHELPIELGTDEVWSVLNKLDQLSAETGKAIVRAEAAEAEAHKWREDAINLAEELRLEQNHGYSCWQLVRHDSLLRGGK